MLWTWRAIIGLKLDPKTWETTQRKSLRTLLLHKPSLFGVTAITATPQYIKALSGVFSAVSAVVFVVYHLNEAVTPSKPFSVVCRRQWRRFCERTFNAFFHAEWTIPFSSCERPRDSSSPSQISSKWVRREYQPPTTERVYNNRDSQRYHNQTFSNLVLIPQSFSKEGTKKKTAGSAIILSRLVCSRHEIAHTECSMAIGYEMLQRRTTKCRFNIVSRDQVFAAVF